MSEGPLALHPSLPPNVLITPITSTTLHAYRRLITLLLPIRYPDKFYKDSIADTTSSSLALCAIWNDSSESGELRKETIRENTGSLQDEADAKIIGGIQCRLEPLPVVPISTGPVGSASPQNYTLYIQTLAVLSPYRSLGIATALLNTILKTAICHYSSAEHLQSITEIYAHVWEANEEALAWYEARGFEIEEGVVEAYYRKLRPGGARVVRRRIGVGDWVKALGGMSSGVIQGAEEGHDTEAKEVKDAGARSERKPDG